MLLLHIISDLLCFSDKGAKKSLRYIKKNYPIPTSYIIQTALIRVLDAPPSQVRC